MALNKYLRYFLYAGIFLVPFVPLFVATNLFFPFITGKNFAFRIIVELIFGGWLILALRDAKYRPKFSWVLGAVLIFVVIIGIADAASIYPYKSFWSNFERMEGYITILHLFAYFLVLSSVLATEKLWTYFFQTTLGVSVIISGYGILQLMGRLPINQGGVRLDGTLGNAAYLGAYVLIHFFIALFLMVRQRKYVWARWVYGAIMALELFILYHTATRGAILGLIFGLFVASAATALLSKGGGAFRKTAIWVLAGIVALVGVATLLRNSSFVQSSPTLVRIADIKKSDAGPRFMVWNMAWQGFKESPKTMLIGWGQESFNYVFNKYYDPKMYAQEQWFDRTHDIVFDWLIAGGILGLLSYLFVFAALLDLIWKQGEGDMSLGVCLKRSILFWKDDKPWNYLHEKSILTGLLAAYFFQNIFVFDNITSYILFFAIAAYIHSISAKPIKALSVEKFPTSHPVAKVFAPLVAIVAVFGVYFINAAPIRAAYTLIDSLRPQSAGPATNLEYFKSALAYNSFGNAEIREQLAQAAIQVLFAQSVDMGVKQNYYDLTRSELQKQLDRTPEDARYYLFYGSFLNRAGNADEAVVQIQKALEFSPKKQTIMFELGSAYINQGNYDKALETMKAAFDLEPDFTEARIIYAVAAIYDKKFDLADEIMSDPTVANTPSVYDDRIISAYTNAGQKSKVVALLEKKVELNPTDVNARLSLAAAYLNVNQRTKAVEILKTITDIDPSQKDKVDYYIKEIQAGRNP